MSESLNALLESGNANAVRAQLARSNVVNPLALVQAANQAASSDYDLMQKQSTLAAGRAFQASIDPNTGLPNQAQFMKNLAGDPMSPMSALDSSQKGQTLDKDTYNLVTARLSRGADALGLLMSRYPQGIPQDAAHAAVDQEVATGLITPEQGTQLKGLFGNDPHANSIAASQLYQHNMNTQQQIDQRFGVPFQKDVGGRIVSGTQLGGMGGGASIVAPGGIDTGLSPQDRTRIVTWNDPDTGRQVTTTLDEMHRRLGIGTPQGFGGGTAGGNAGGATGGQPGGQTGGTGGAPGPGAARESAPSVQPTAPPGNGPVRTAQGPRPAAEITGPRPGQTEAQKDAATAGVAMGNDLVKRGDQAPANKAVYANMLTDLDRLGRMPPGGERQIAVETFLQKLTGRNITMTPDEIAASNSFAKLSNILIGQQLAAMGGTDQRQQLFMGSNPNLDLSKLGNEQIIHMLQGNEDAIQAKARAWVKWSAKNGADTYQQFQDDFNRHFDPRVFQQQYYGPDEVAHLKKFLQQRGEEGKFWTDHKWAKDNGMIP